MLCQCIYRRRKERLHRRYMLQNQPETAVPRLQPITHREGSATLAPALQVCCCRTPASNTSVYIYITGPVCLSCHATAPDWLPYQATMQHVEAWQQFLKGESCRTDLMDGVTHCRQRRQAPG